MDSSVEKNGKFNEGRKCKRAQLLKEKKREMEMDRDGGGGSGQGNMVFLHHLLYQRKERDGDGDPANWEP